MTNDPLDNPLRELSWRRELTAAEQVELRAWLRAHPEAQADWEAETGLTDVLGRLPDVPVASNFTARVLQAVERETAAETCHRQVSWPGRLRLLVEALAGRRVRWLPRMALLAVFAVTGLVSSRYFEDSRHSEMVQSMEVVARVAPLPSPQVLENFDAIRAMSSTPPDEELLALLQ